MPQQIASSPHNPTTTLSSPQNETGPSPKGGGPSRKSYTIPPRPKPGRKPATDEPALKRKAQNRESQRAFRARKAQKVQELHDAAVGSERKHKTELNEKLAEIDRLRTEVRRLQDLCQQQIDECDYWKQHYLTIREGSGPTTLEQVVPNPFRGPVPVLYSMGSMGDARHDTPHRASMSSSHTYASPKTAELLGCDQCVPNDCSCMTEIANNAAFQSSLRTPIDSIPLPSRSNSVSPMTGIQRSGPAQMDEESRFADREIDFTTKYHRSRQRLRTAFLPSNEIIKDHDCGWCEDHPEYCLCKDLSLRPVGEDASVPLSQVTTSPSIEHVKPGPLTNEPGSCSDCQNNPQQQAWCRRVAQLRSEATARNSRRTSIRSTTLDVMEPKAVTRIDPDHAYVPLTIRERSIGCSETFKLLDGRVPLDANNMDWRNLKPVSTSMHHDSHSDTFTMEPGTYSAFELDASSVLTTLQHSINVLEPRPSDGRFAPLIQEAECRRRAISPITEPGSLSVADALAAFNAID